MWFSFGRRGNVAPIRHPCRQSARKKQVYERTGLEELWLVDTASNSVLVYRRSDPSIPEFDLAVEASGGEVLTSPQLPGFELAVAAVFEA